MLSCRTFVLHLQLLHSLLVLSWQPFVHTAGPPCSMTDFCLYHCCVCFRPYTMLTLFLKEEVPWAAMAFHTVWSLLDNANRWWQLLRCYIKHSYVEMLVGRPYLTRDSVRLHSNIRYFALLWFLNIITCLRYICSPLLITDLLQMLRRGKGILSPVRFFHKLSFWYSNSFRHQKTVFFLTILKKCQLPLYTVFYFTLDVYFRQLLDTLQELRTVALLLP